MKKKGWIVFLVLFVGGLLALGGCYGPSVVHCLVEWGIGKACGARFTYREMNWRGGRLVLFDALVCREGEVKLQAPRVEVAFAGYPFTVFVSLEGPKVTLLGEGMLWREASLEGSWIDWRCKVVDGVFEWPTVGVQARFALERTAPWQVGKLVVETGAAEVQLEMFREGADMRVDVQLSRFYLPLLETWLRYGGYDVQLQEGLADGWIYAERRGSEWGRMVAHLDVREVRGTIYGREIALGKALFTFDGPVMEPNRVRLECAGGRFGGPDWSVDQVSGQLSYDSDVGMKSEWRSVGRVDGEEAPLAISSKGFWSEREKPWFELQGNFSQGTCSFGSKGSEWSLRLQQIEPFWGRLVQRGGGSFTKGFAKTWLGYFPWREGEISCALYGKEERVELRELEVRGEKLLQGSLYVELQREGQTRGFSFQGGPFLFSSRFSAERAQGRLLIDSEGWSLEKASVELKVGEREYALYVLEWMQRSDSLFFDVRVSEGNWDIIRLVGEEKEGRVRIDPKAEVFGCFLKLEPWEWGQSQPLSAHVDLSLEHLETIQSLCRAAGVAIPRSLQPLFASPMHIDALYHRDQGCVLEILGDSSWKARLSQTKEGWPLEVSWGQSSLYCLLGYSQKMWTLKEGVGSLQGEVCCRFEGQCALSGQGQLRVSECTMSSSGSTPIPWRGQVKGKGCLTFDWSSSQYEIDCDIRSALLHADSLSYEQKKPAHLFFSPSQGLMVQGIGGGLSIEGAANGACSIELLHWDPSRALWLFTEAHIHLPEEALPLLERWGSFPLSGDIDCIADLECASDFSFVSCVLKDLLFSWGGEMRRVRDVYLGSHGKHFACDGSYPYQNRDLRVHLSADRSSQVTGSFALQDPEDLSASLSIGWRYDPSQGLAIDSIQGKLGGVEASFTLQQTTETHSHLIGSAKLDFAQLSQWISPSIAEVFTELELGRGYSVSGTLQIDRKDPSLVGFHGIFHGKQVELLGYRFRSLFSHIDIKPQAIQINGIKIVDSAGLFTADQILIQEDKEWVFSIPQILISEFRPTLLRTIKGDPGEMSPLVIRRMTFRDVKGILDCRETYTSEGELYFINSYRREKTLFDLPSEILSRLIGLDMELLIPVRGTLRYVLQGGKLRITSLEDAYSEWGRSQFFLVCNDHSPTVDLDGNLHIQITMKQYVLFKLTEAFGIFIDGKLNRPQYHLQTKKSLRSTLPASVSVLPGGES